ncbi:MAG: hypothetical protein OEY93_12940 [Anaerolineae bacterium]|nr:hypothetical protein [Anaerolineae bacterium]
MEVKIGTVTHYFSKISVAVLCLSEDLNLGDQIHIQGHTTDLIQTIGSMEVEHDKVETACPGMDVAIRVADRVRAGDIVFRVAEKVAG